MSTLAFHVFEAHCAECGTALLPEALPHELNQHREHLMAVSLRARIVGPKEYRGLELKLPADLSIDRDHPSLEKVLHLPGIVFQFSCLQCQSQNAVTESEVHLFRSSHARHIHRVCLHVVVQNHRGKAVRLTVPVLAQKDAQSGNSSQAPTPSTATIAQADRLRGLLQTLHCIPRSFQCSLCRSACLPEDVEEIEQEIARHKRHRSELQVEFRVERPEEYLGLQLRIRAKHLPPQSICPAPQSKLDCIFLELTRERSGPVQPPWNATTVEDYLQQYHSPSNPAKLLTLVRGPIYAHVCQFQVTRVPFITVSEVSEWEQLFLQAAGEEA